MRPLRKAGWLGFLLVSLLTFVSLTAELASADAGGLSRAAVAYDGPARDVPSANWESHDQLLPIATARPGSMTAAPDTWGIADLVATAHRNVVLGRIPPVAGLARLATGVSPSSCRAPPAS